MSAIRIETQISGETLYLPQLKSFVGKSVEIVVTELPVNPWPPVGEPWVSPLSGTVSRFVEPLEPAATAEEWEAAK